MSETRQDQLTIKLYNEFDSPTGVDDFMLLEQLRLTPEQRLEMAEHRMRNILELRRAVRRADESGS